MRAIVRQSSGRVGTGALARPGGRSPSAACSAAEGTRTIAAANKNTLFLPFPQEVSPLHSFYTTHPHFPVALIFSLPQSACSQKREMF
jgi:hypothetical protein